MTSQSLVTSLRVFSWLLWFDIRLLYKDFLNNLLDALAWPIALIVVNGYIMPTLGMPENFGAFTAVSMVVIMGAYKAWTAAMPVATDLAGPQAISYELTLPLPYWMVWVKYGLSMAIQAAAFNVVPLLLGKIILGSKFDLSHFSLLWFMIIYLAACLFFGMFALWSTVITKTIEGHFRLELRLIGPMFFLNGWTASWAAMYAASPILGVFVRFLPWIYAYEGCRVAVFGQQGYIDFWTCLLRLLLWALFLALMSIKLFKKRMDCV